VAFASPNRKRGREGRRKKRLRVENGHGEICFEVEALSGQEATGDAIRLNGEQRQANGGSDDDDDLFQYVTKVGKW